VPPRGAGREAVAEAAAAVSGQGGQIDLEGRAPARFARHLDASRRVVSRCQNRGQTEARALARLFGGEKRLENARQDFRRIPQPVSLTRKPT
jgi:hypothetical protein